MALSETNSIDLSALHNLDGLCKNIPSWVSAAREPARDAFLDKGWPTRKDEHWGYTSLRSLRETSFKWSHTKGLVTKAELKKHLDPDHIPVVFVDGVYDSTQAFAPELPEGVTIRSLKYAFSEHEESLKEGIKLASQSSHAFELLNQAFLMNGVFIKVESGVTLDKPIHILYFNTAKKEPFSIFPRVVVDLGTSAEASLIVSHESEGGSRYFHNSINQIRLAANASLKHFTIQNSSPESYSYEASHVDIEKDARYSNFHLGVGSKLGRHELKARLLGEGCDLVADGLYLSKDKQQIENYLFVDHTKPNCTSSQTFKGLLAEQGKGVFSGEISVRQHAQQTRANQMNKNLLLSDTAEVNTKPQLLIDADDVKCSHGATIGQLKEEELFYLTSRGIGQQEARAMLAKGFALDLILNISDEFFRKYASQLLNKWVEEL